MYKSLNKPVLHNEHQKSPKSSEGDKIAIFQEVRNRAVGQYWWQKACEGDWIAEGYKGLWQALKNVHARTKEKKQAGEISAERVEV